MLQSSSLGITNNQNAIITDKERRFGLKISIFDIPVLNKARFCNFKVILDVHLFFPLLNVITKTTIVIVIACERQPIAGTRRM
jgi:hypothetical protein